MFFLLFGSQVDLICSVALLCKCVRSCGGRLFRRHKWHNWKSGGGEGAQLRRVVAVAVAARTNVVDPAAAAAAVNERSALRRVRLRS